MAGWLSIFALLVLASCTSDVPETLSPTKRPTATPTAQTPIGPTAAAAQLGKTVPCDLEPRSQGIQLSDDASGPPLGIGGDEEEPVDEGKQEPPPDDPDAVDLDAPALPTLGRPAPGGVGADDLKPVYFAQTSSHIFTAGTVAEPNVASDGTNVLMTWNQYAGVSTDRGSTFRWMDPGAFMSSDSFCCDQLAHYIPSRRLWVWVMQTGWPPGHPNLMRIAVSHGGQPFANPIQFTYWELTPRAGGFFGADAWMDRPKIGNTNQYLFVTMNTYDVNWEGYGSLVARIPLDDLAAGTTAKADCYGSDLQAVPVAVAQDTMYMADHISTAKLQLWKWPDASTAPELHEVDDVDDQRKVKYNAVNFACPRKEISQTDWCKGKADYRIQSAWLNNGRIGLAWNAAPFSEFDAQNNRLYPYVYIAFISEESLSVVGHWTVKAQDGAVQYPMFAPNARGDVGGVMLYGGGPYPADTPGDQSDDWKGYPSCVTGIFDGSTEESSFSIAPENQSTTDPRPAGGEKYSRIGDYVGIWANGGNDMTWSGGCMTYTEAGTQVEFFRFGRAGDNPG